MGWLNSSEDPGKFRDDKCVVAPPCSCAITPAAGWGVGWGSSLDFPCFSAYLNFFRGISSTQNPAGSARRSSTVTFLFYFCTFSIVSWFAPTAPLISSDSQLWKGNNWKKLQWGFAEENIEDGHKWPRKSWAASSAAPSLTSLWVSPLTKNNSHP